MRPRPKMPALPLHTHDMDWFLGVGHSALHAMCTSWIVSKMHKKLLQNRSDYQNSNLWSPYLWLWLPTIPCNGVAWWFLCHIQSVLYCNFWNTSPDLRSLHESVTKRVLCVYTIRTKVEMVSKRSSLAEFLSNVVRKKSARTKYKYKRVHTAMVLVMFCYMNIYGFGSIISMLFSRGVGFGGVKFGGVVYSWNEHTAWQPKRYTLLIRRKFSEII